MPPPARPLHLLEASASTRVIPDGHPLARAIISAVEQFL